MNQDIRDVLASCHSSCCFRTLSPFRRAQLQFCGARMPRQGFIYGVLLPWAFTSLLSSSTGVAPENNSWVKTNSDVAKFVMSIDGTERGTMRSNEYRNVMSFANGLPLSRLSTRNNSLFSTRDVRGGDEVHMAIDPEQAGHFLEEHALKSKRRVKAPRMEENFTPANARQFLSERSIVEQKHPSSSETSIVNRELETNDTVPPRFDPCQNETKDGSTITLCTATGASPIFNISYIKRMKLLGFPCPTLCSLPSEYTGPRLFSEDACQTSCANILRSPGILSSCTQSMCQANDEIVVDSCRRYCRRVSRDLTNPTSLLYIPRFWALSLCEACLRGYVYSNDTECSWTFELWTPLTASSYGRNDTCRVRGRFISPYFNRSRVLEYV
jgi:hypothetical protein